MTMASLGWGVWVVVLVLERYGVRLFLWLPTLLSTGCAVVGLGYAVWSLRARAAWLWFVVVPLLANAGLLLVPWLAAGLLDER